MSPEDVEELELLRRDVEVLGGDPNAVLARAQGGDFSKVGSYGYEYKDPGAQGAAAGPQAGPMAQELRGLPGVVKSGPDGFDRVDPARLSLTNASATGELAREVEALRSEVAALGGNPEAVLARAQANAASSGPTVEAQMPTGRERAGVPPGGEMTDEELLEYLGDASVNEHGFGPIVSPEPVRRGTPEIRQGTPRDDWWKLSHEERARLMREEDEKNAAALRADFALQERRDNARRESEFRNSQTMRAENVERGSDAWWEANQNRQAPLDRDERDRQALLVETETARDPKLAPYSDEDIKRYIASIENMSSHGEQQGQVEHELRMPTTRSPLNLSNQINRDPRTGNARANIRPEDIERVLRSREELYL